MKEEKIPEEIAEDKILGAAVRTLESLRLEALEKFPEDAQDAERFHFFIDVWQSSFLLMIGKFVHEEYRSKVSDNILRILKKNLKSHKARGDSK